MAKHNLIDTFENKDILAKRAEMDIHGRSIPETYATYEYVKQKSFADFGKSFYGKYMTDEEGTPILDEDGGYLYNEDSVQLWTSFREKGFGAERAIADENGNNIATTYATKAEVDAAMGDIETLLADL